MSDHIEEAVRAALDGQLIVIPTDTVYGIGTRPDLEESTARIFEAKRRPPEMDLPVLVPSMEAAHEISRLGLSGRLLARAFWPGPLTIVVRRAGPSTGWELGGNPESIGLRMPNHEKALAILARTGPLAVTSANISGRPTPSTCEEVAGLFGDAVATYVCEMEPLSGRPSSVVDLRYGEPKVLREGAIAGEDVLNALRTG